MKKRNLIYTGLLMLSMLTTPVYAADKNINVMNGVCFFNEGDASITIQANTNQSMKGKTFRMYRLFDVEVAGDNSSISYTLNPVYAAKIKTIVGEKIGKAADEQDVLDYMRSLNNTSNQSEYRTFVEAIQKAVESLDAVVIHVDSTDESGNITFDKLRYGYYLIDEVTSVSNTHGAASLTMVNTANPNVTMNIKSDYPSVVKKIFEDDNSIGWNDIGDFEINQDIQYKYESRIPDMSGYSTYFYEFEDEMDPCLTLKEESVKLQIKNQVVAKDKYTFTKTTNGFKITFNDLKQFENINKDDPVEFSYSAFLNENASKKMTKAGYENKVCLHFSNDPQNDSRGKTPWDSVVCYTYRLNGLKTNEKNVKLQGATFKLYRDSKLQDQVKLKKNGNGYVVSSDVSEDVVSNEKGVFEIYGLDQGTYYLKETKAPEGYQMLREAVEIKITPTFIENRNNYRSNSGGLINLEASSFDNALNASYTDATIALKVINQTGTKLPITGSMGTLACVVTGAGIMVYVCKKKKKE